LIWSVGEDSSEEEEGHLFKGGRRRGRGEDGKDHLPKWIAGRFQDRGLRFEGAGGDVAILGRYQGTFGNLIKQKKEKAGVPVGG